MCIEEKVKAYIKENGLLSKGDCLVLGVSGGADSMMLLHLFYKLQEEYELELLVAHIHHGIRESAQADAQLVKETCERLNIPFYRHDCNIKELAKARGISEEEAGRQERYNFFISLLKPRGKIVTAHNMNDQAETMLMRFFRGSDIKGLGGILPKRQQLIRPLLCLARGEIEAYCAKMQIEYHHDETNFQPIYMRNKLRLECIPYIEAHVNPSIVKTLSNCSSLYQEEEAYLREETLKNYNKLVSLKENKVYIDLKQLLLCHSYMRKRILLMAIEEISGHSKDISLKHIEAAASFAYKQSGKRMDLPYGVVLTRQYDSLIIGKKVKKTESYCENLELGTHYIREANLEITLKIVKLEIIGQKKENICTKYIDYGRIKNGLQIRTRQEADYIKLGLGTKKIKKLFVDDKIPAEVRGDVPLIADGNEIIWVVGGRLNTDYYITDKTKQVLEIQIMYRHEQEVLC